MLDIKKEAPALADALSLLIKDHFEHIESTPAFYKRSRILIQFCNDIGFQLKMQINSRSIQLLSLNASAVGAAGAAGEPSSNGLEIILETELPEPVVINAQAQAAGDRTRLNRLEYILETRRSRPLVYPVQQASIRHGSFFTTTTSGSTGPSTAAGAAASPLPAKI